MPGRRITDLIIHCSASPNGLSLARRGLTAIQTIDQWHGERIPPFNRAQWRLRTRPHLKHVGYHYVINVDGQREEGRELDEIGAHVAGRNRNSIGICLVGGDRFTPAQWAELRVLVFELLARFPEAATCGHRDCSPDLNGDGRISSNEWIKNCPNFDVAAWIAAGYQPRPENVFNPPNRGPSP